MRAEPRLTRDADVPVAVADDTEAEVAVVLTSNTALAAMPGNVFLPAAATGLRRDCVANVAAVVTLNKDELEGPAGSAPSSLMHDVDRGLRRVLGL